MSDKYRKKVKPIENFHELKNKEINCILNKVQDKRLRFNYKFSIKILVPVTVFIITFLFYQHIFIPGIEPTTSNDYIINKVNAQEYVISGNNATILFKSYAVTENPLIKYNDDFSYYPTLSKYNDHSYLIGKEIPMSIKVYNFYGRHFIYVNGDGKKSYWEAIGSGYNGISNFTEIYELKGFNFTDFETDMKKVLQMIQDYPPILTGKFNETKGHVGYTYNPNIQQIKDNRAVENYKNYVENDYVTLSNSKSDTNTGFVFNYVFIINDENEVIKQEPFITMGGGSKEDLSKDYFNPIIDGFDLPLNYKNTHARQWFVIDNDRLNARLYIKTYGTCENEKYDHQTTAYLFMDTEKLLGKDKKISKITITDNNTKSEYQFKDIHNYKNYLYTIPIIITNSKHIYDITLHIYDNDGQDLYSQHFGPLFLPN